MGKFFVIGGMLFLVAMMYAACIMAGRADDREECWFEKRNK